METFQPVKRPLLLDTSALQALQVPLCAPGLGREEWDFSAVGVETLREEDQCDEKSQAFVGRFLGRKSQGEKRKRTEDDDTSGEI